MSCEAHAARIDNDAATDRLDDHDPVMPPDRHASVGVGGAGEQASGGGDPPDDRLEESSPFLEKYVAGLDVASDLSILMSRRFAVLLHSGLWRFVYEWALQWFHGGASSNQAYVSRIVSNEGRAR